MKKKSKGFTITEMLICIFIFSVILAGVAAAISKVGDVTRYSSTDISTRSSQNKLFNELNVAVHSLVSVYDSSYSSITEGGLVVEDIISEELIELNGKTYRKVKANKITLYTKGDVNKRVLSLEKDPIQDRAPVLLTGSLYDGCFRFQYDEEGNIIQENMKEESTTPCVMYTSVGEDNYESYFEVIIDGEILNQITFALVLPKLDYQSKQSTLTQSCPQEVKVVCVS